MSDPGPVNLSIVSVDKEQIKAKIEQMKQANNQLHPKELVRLLVDNGQKLLRFYNKPNVPDQHKRPAHDNGWQDRPGLTYDEACEALDQGYFLAVQVENRYFMDVDNPEAIDFFYQCFDELVASGAFIDQSPNGFHVGWANKPDLANLKDGIRGSNSVLQNGCCVTPRTKNNCIIISPSTGRFNITPVERLWSALPVVPDHWVPVCSKEAWDKRKQAPAAQPALKSSTAQQNKLSNLDDALKTACEEILTALEGGRNSVHNKCIYTVAGLVAGAVQAGLPVNEQAFLDDLVAAARTNMANDPDKAEKDARSSWAAGSLKPLAVTVKSISDSKRQIRRVAAQNKNPKAVPVPGDMCKVHESAEAAVDHLLGKYEMFQHGELLYVAPKGTDNFHIVASLPGSSSQTPANLTAFYKANIEWYDFSNLKTVVWPRDMEPSITAELVKQVPKVRYYGIPCFLDDQWIETSSHDVRIKPLQVDQVTCSPAESLAWLQNELQHDFCYASEKDKNKAMGVFLAPFIRSSYVENVAPAIVYNAPESGVGKTIQAFVAHSIGSDEERSPKLIHSSADENEVRKNITSALIGGASSLLWDNVKKKMEGQVFETLTSSSEWSDRVLGSSQSVTIPMTARVYITLNKNVMSDDVCRRIIAVTTNKNPHIAMGGACRHQNLPLWVRQNIGQVRGHAMNVVRSWAMGGAVMGNSQAQSSYQYYTSCLEGVLDSVGLHVGNLIDLAENKRMFADDDNSQATDLLVQWLFQRYGTRDWTATGILETLIADQSDKYKIQSGDISCQINLDSLIPEYDRLQGQGYLNKRNRIWSRRIAKDVNRLVITEDGKQLYIRERKRGMNGQVYCIQHANPAPAMAPLPSVGSSSITF